MYHEQAQTYTTKIINLMNQDKYTIMATLEMKWGKKSL